MHHTRLRQWMLGLIAMSMIVFFTMTSFRFSEEHEPVSEKKESHNVDVFRETCMDNPTTHKVVVEVSGHFRTFGMIADQLQLWLDSSTSCYMVTLAVWNEVESSTPAGWKPDNFDSSKQWYKHTLEEEIEIVKRKFHNVVFLSGIWDRSHTEKVNHASQPFLWSKAHELLVEFVDAHPRLTMKALLPTTMVIRTRPDVVFEHSMDFSDFFEVLSPNVSQVLTFHHNRDEHDYRDPPETVFFCNLFGYNHMDFTPDYEKAVVGQPLNAAIPKSVFFFNPGRSGLCKFRFQLRRLPPGVDFVFPWMCPAKFSPNYRKENAFRVGEQGECVLARCQSVSNNCNGRGFIFDPPDTALETMGLTPEQAQKKKVTRLYHNVQTTLKDCFKKQQHVVYF